MRRAQVGNEPEHCVIIIEMLRQTLISDEFLPELFHNPLLLKLSIILYLHRWGSIFEACGAFVQVFLAMLLAMFVECSLHLSARKRESLESSASPSPL